MKLEDLLRGVNPIEDLQSQIDDVGAGQDSFQKSLNVALSGTVQIIYTGGAVTIDTTSVLHNLGYTPAFLCFLLNNGTGGTYQPFPYLDFGTGGSTLASDANVVADSQKLQFSWNHRIAQPANTITIKYYIFYEPASVG